MAILASLIVGMFGLFAVFLTAWQFPSRGEIGDAIIDNGTPWILLLSAIALIALATWKVTDFEPAPGVQAVSSRTARVLAALTRYFGAGVGAFLVIEGVLVMFDPEPAAILVAVTLLPGMLLLASILKSWVGVGSLRST